MAQAVVARALEPVRALVPLGLVFLAVGTAMAVAQPFLALFLSTDVHADPIQVAVFLVAAPLSGVIASTLLARMSDRRPIRRTLVIAAAAAGLVGMALTAFVRSYSILLAVAVTATAVAGTLFPQAFAYAGQVLARGDAGRAALGINALRTVFSLAWVAGPPLAALVLRLGGFGWLFGMAAMCYGAAALVAITWLREIGAPGDGAARARGPAGSPGTAGVSRGTLLWTASAFVLLQCPLTLGAQTLPLFISTDLGGRASDAGLILGLCAALEMPLMIGLGLLATRVGLRALLLAGACGGVGYYAVAASVRAVWALAAGQVVNAAFIAVVSGLGISYMQQMLPGQPGRASTLFGNSFPIGAMLAGPLFGLAQHAGYRFAYASGAVLCVAGLLLLAGPGRWPARLSQNGPGCDARPGSGR